MGIFNKIFSAKVLPSWTILLFDLLIAIVSVAIGYMLRYGITLPGRETMMFWTMVLVAIFDFIFFRIFNTYSNVLRFSSFIDLLNIVAAIFLSFLCCLAVSQVARFAFGYTLASFPALIISFALCFVLMTAMRLFIKTIYDEIHMDQKESIDVFIYGTTAGGVNIAKSLRITQANKFNLCGFIADDMEMKGKVMMGVNVYMNDDKLLEHMAAKHIKGVIVSPIKMEHINDNNFADTLLKAGIQLFSAPSITDEWQATLHKTSPIQAMQIEELLMREPIKVNMEQIASDIEGKKILITGAAGSIGSEIMRQVAAFNPYQLILIDNAETPLHDIRLELTARWRNINAPTIVANIANPKRIESIFAQYRPDYVFHAAAYKHVPMMEDNVSEAIQNNILGTKIVADMSLKYGVEKFVMISTDKAVNPSNVMGCSKRICEIYIQALAKKLQKEGRTDATQFITTRFGNVLDSSGSVIPLFRRQIERGGPVTVTHPDIIRYFMTIPEACQLVLEAGSMGVSGEIYIFDMGNPVKIVDLAKKMITLSGRTDIKIEFTGLRHGEKLYEELLNPKENTTATKHDKIWIAKVTEYDFGKASAAIQDIIDTSYNFDTMETVGKMKQLVPEFKSLNSTFSTLD